MPTAISLETWKTIDEAARELKAAIAGPRERLLDLLVNTARTMKQGGHYAEARLLLDRYDILCQNDIHVDDLLLLVRCGGGDSSKADNDTYYEPECVPNPHSLGLVHPRS